MISLGQASNYNFARALGHLFAHGGEKDSVALRNELASRYGAEVENVALYHSGRSALTVALEAVAKPGSKVIIPGLTCIAVVQAIKAAGMEPVFADITEEDLEYDYKKLDNTAKACYNGIIVIQNTLGCSWDVHKIEQVAKKYQLAIVEDLAHCAGRFYSDGREVGTVGRAAALSFGKGKAIDTINGGAVILRRAKTGDRERSPEAIAQPPIPSQLPKFSERLRDRWYPVLAGMCRTTWRIGLGKALMAMFVKFGWVKRSADTELDTDVRLTNWQAKLALKQLKTLPREALREFKLVERRADLLRELDRAGYNFHEIWYDTPVSPARYSGEADFPVEKCPKTVRISKQIINLPTWYPESKLVKAREIIAKYEIGGRND